MIEGTSRKHRHKLLFSAKKKVRTTLSVQTLEQTDVKATIVSLTTAYDGRKLFVITNQREVLTLVDLHSDTSNAWSRRHSRLSSAESTMLAP